MPLLAGLLVSLFGSIAEFFALGVARKTAAVLAGIAIMAVITAALWVAMSALVVAIAVVMPTASYVLLGCYLFVPDNALACISACFAADTAIAIYRLNVLNVQFAVYAP
jgi:hypothetical protein